MKFYKNLIIGILFIFIGQSIKAQENPNYSAGHNIVQNAHRQVDAVNRDDKYTKWINASEHILDGSLDTRCVNMQMIVETNFDDSAITVSSSISASSLNFINYLNSISADPYIYHSLLGNVDMGTEHGHNRSPGILSASYLAPNALNLNSILFHENTGHGSMAGNNSDHDSGKLVAIQINVGTESSPNWVNAGNDESVMHANGGMQQVATTNPTQSTARPDNYIYMPHIGTLEPNMARTLKSELAHTDPTLNTLTIVKDHWLTYPQKVINLGDVETVTLPTYSIDETAGTITITNDTSDYSGSLEIIVGTGITNPDEYSLHFYNASGVLINPNGDVGYRFTALYTGQPNPAISYPTDTEFIAILNNDQNVKSTLVALEVTDTEAPTINTNPFTVYLDATGNATWSFSDFDNGTSDNSESWTVASFSPSSINCSNVGTLSVSFTITDVTGNESTGTEIGTVIDNTNPTLTTQNITGFVNSGGNYTVNSTDFVSTSNDACGIASTTLNITSFSCSDLGTNTVQVTVTDPSGNYITLPATLTLNDNTNPIAQTQNIEVDIESGAQTITTSMINNGSSDNCSVDNMSIDLDYFDTVGTFNGTFTVNDASGNSDTEPYTVEVINTLAVNDQEIAGFEIYPNPTNSILNITATENIKKIILYNSLGQIVLEKQINANESKMNIEKLSNGIYILKTYGENKTGIRQIIKE